MNTSVEPCDVIDDEPKVEVPENAHEITHSTDVLQSDSGCVSGEVFECLHRDNKGTNRR